MERDNMVRGIYLDWIIINEAKAKISFNEM